MKPVDERLPQRLTANRIRFAYLPIVRRGYQQRAVRELLALAADEILRLHQRLAAAYAETDRVKRRLHEWQAVHGVIRRPRPCQDGYRHDRHDRHRQPVRERWPIN